MWEETFTNLSIKDIKVTDTATDEELALEMLQGLKPYVYDWIDVRDPLLKEANTGFFEYLLFDSFYTTFNL